jgi:predicted MFS family arabinose efflux permease
VDGFRYVYHTRPIRSLLTMVAATSLSGMPALVLMPFFAEDIFHRGSRGLGFLMAAMGVGAIVGTLVLAKRARTAGLYRVVFLGALTLGAAFVLFAVSSSFYFAVAMMAVIGFSVMRQNASANTLIQTLIPDEYRGRTMALYSMTVVGIGPFGSLAAGGLANHIGARLTVVCGGVLCLVAAVWFGLRQREAVSR